MWCQCSCPDSEIGKDLSEGESMANIRVPDVDGCGPEAPLMACHPGVSTPSDQSGVVATVPATSHYSDPGFSPSTGWRTSRGFLGALPSGQGPAHTHCTLFIKGASSLLRALPLFHPPTALGVSKSHLLQVFSNSSDQGTLC